MRTTSTLQRAPSITALALEPSTQVTLAKRFFEVVLHFEKPLVQSGIIRIKYWPQVSREEQPRRVWVRIDDGRKLC